MNLSFIQTIKGIDRDTRERIVQEIAAGPTPWFIDREFLADVGISRPERGALLLELRQGLIEQRLQRPLQAMHPTMRSALRALASEGDAMAAFHAAEAALRIASVVLLDDYLLNRQSMRSIDRIIQDFLPRPTMGHLVAFIRELSGAVNLRTAGHPVARELRAPFGASAGFRRSVGTVLDEFERVVECRNVMAHRPVYETQRPGDARHNAEAPSECLICSRPSPASLVRCPSVRA
jgi:hypothetical protein